MPLPVATGAAPAGQPQAASGASIHEQDGSLGLEYEWILGWNPGSRVDIDTLPRDHHCRDTQHHTTDHRGALKFPVARRNLCGSTAVHPLVLAIAIPDQVMVVHQPRSSHGWLPPSTPTSFTPNPPVPRTALIRRNAMKADPDRLTLARQVLARLGVTSPTCQAARIPRQIPTLGRKGSREHVTC